MPLYYSGSGKPKAILAPGVPLAASPDYPLNCVAALSLGRRDFQMQAHLHDRFRLDAVHFPASERRIQGGRPTFVMGGARIVA